MTRRKLTPKQRRFVERYLLTLNASDAADHAGYSPRSAPSLGSRLLQTPSVRQAIEDAAAENSARAKIENETILRELGVVVTSSIDNYEIVDGRVRVRAGVPSEAIRAIRSVKLHREFDYDGKLRSESISITLWDKPKGLALAMRRLGLLKDEVNVQHSGQVVMYIPFNGRDSRESLDELVRTALAPNAKSDDGRTEAAKH